MKPMWVPKSEQEILDRIEDGSLQETAVLDFKRELGKNSKEIAKDVAAMSTDGGVIIYGIDEDEDGRPSARPMALAHQPERLDQIVQSGIHEPLTIQVSTVVSAQGAGLGYLVVLVPPSARAPHMVQIRGDNRYYGRGATGNRLLGQGEVARLYERRQEWQQSAEGVLRETIEDMGIEPEEGRGHLHVVVKPLLTDDEFLERVLEDDKQQTALGKLLRDVDSESLGNRSLADNFSKLFEPCAFGWRSGLQAPRHVGGLEYQASLEISYSGEVRLFDNRVTKDFQPESQPRTFPFVIEPVVSRDVLFVLRVATQLYDRGGYVGPIMCAVSLRGIRDKHSGFLWEQTSFWGPENPYDRDEYRRGGRFLSFELLQDPFEVGAKLLDPLFRTTTRGQYRPFDRKE